MTDSPDNGPRMWQPTDPVDLESNKQNRINELNKIGVRRKPKPRNDGSREKGDNKGKIKENKKE